LTDKVLQLSAQFGLPYEMATWVVAYLAKRGGGKTYNAAVQAEEMLKAGIPIVVIDGMGIWYGLRIGKEGKGDGLPIIVFGGEHGDLPLLPDKATEMARSIVESNISCVIDTSDLSRNQSRKVVTDFLNELYKINRQDRHVFIEEADMFAPQRPMGEEAVCLGAVDNFVRRGGNHNLGCTLITQRSAVLNKNILTQADCLMVGRTLAPQDKEAVQAWVEEYSEKDKTEIKKWLDSLKELGNGEFYVWHPDKPVIFEKIQFRERETFHATRQFIKSKESQTIKLMDVGSFVSKFRNVFQEKARDIKPISLRTREELISDCLELQRNLGQANETNGNLRGKISFRDTQIDALGHQLDSLRVQLQEAQKRKLSDNAPIISDQILTIHPEIDPENIINRVMARVKDLLPKQTSSGALNIETDQVDLNITTSFKPESFDTSNLEGKIMYVLCNEFKGKSTQYKDLKEAIREHAGWTVDDGNFTRAKKALRDRNMIQDDSKHTTMQLPIKLGRIFIDGKEVA